MTLAFGLIFVVVVIGGLGYAAYTVQTMFLDARDKREADYKAHQAGLDDQVRAEGHSEEYVGKERQIRALKSKRRDAKIGYYAAWIGGIICLFVFPPIGIFLTGFAIIMSIREGRKLRQEMRNAAYEVKAVRDSMPEK